MPHILTNVLYALNIAELSRRRDYPTTQLPYLLRDSSPTNGCNGSPPTAVDDDERSRGGVIADKLLHSWQQIVMLPLLIEIDCWLILRSVANDEEDAVTTVMDDVSNNSLYGILHRSYNSSGFSLISWTICFIAWMSLTSTSSSSIRVWLQPLVSLNDPP